MVLGFSYEEKIRASIDKRDEDTLIKTISSNRGKLNDTINNVKQSYTYINSTIPLPVYMQQKKAGLGH